MGGVVRSEVAAPPTLRAAKGLLVARRDNRRNIEADYWGQTTMHGTTTTQLNCVDCNALYHLIKVEAGPETVDRELNCRACGAPLPAREGQFVLKYFLLRKPSWR
jgi:hypothetical protein